MGFKTFGLKTIISYILLGMMSITFAGCGNITEETQVEEVQAEDEQMEETQTIVEMTPPLRDSFDNTDCRIGCEVTYQELKDDKVWEIITTHFSAVTLGNELKPDALFGYSNDKCPGTITDEIDGQELEVPIITYSRTEEMLDRFLEWNEANPDKPIKLRGHVLVWHSQTPEWFFHEDYDKKKAYVDKDTMSLREEWYIKTVLTHFVGEDSKYKDLFYGWDVVNEAISDNGGLRTEGTSWWNVFQSEEFIINAFKYANKYAPENLELYYNDYNECNATKRADIIKLLEDIKTNEGEPGVGTRISGMGMQGHYGMDDPSFSSVQTSIEEYSKVVDSVQITEFDIKASDDYDGSAEAKEAEYEKLRKRYNTLYYGINAAAANEEVNLTGITFWGTVDHYSWLQNRNDVGGGSKDNHPQCPLLFDDNYEPKSCFWVFVKE